MPAGTESDPHQRASERSNVFLGATLYTEARSFPVRIRNLSAGGALLDGVDLPREGSFISLRRGHLAADGQVAWQTDDLRGVHFNSAIDVKEWVKPRVHAGQQRVDMTVAAVRKAKRQALPGRLTGPSPHFDTMGSIIAALEQICERLAGSPKLTDDLAEELVRLDSIIHSLRHLSSSKDGAQGSR
jgi:hypothetical protein